ncbi:hypothetical protein GBA52_006645 [Prunus armeniaca]|nr:hypothetical protein GBA52_006645 [Prunus armeniaca]
MAAGERKRWWRHKGGHEFRRHSRLPLQNMWFQTNSVGSQQEGELSNVIIQKHGLAPSDPWPL